MPVGFHTDRQTAQERKLTYFGQMKERLFEEVFGAADVLGYGVGGVVTAAKSRPFLSAQTSAVVASTWVGTCTVQHKPVHFNDEQCRSSSKSKRGVDISVSFCLSLSVWPMAS